MVAVETGGGDMSLLLPTLVLVLALGFVTLGVFFIRLYGRAVCEKEKVIVIVVKDQEPWLEGFMRKFFSQVRNTAGVQVRVIDDASCDRTVELLQCLQRTYPFALQRGRDEEMMRSREESSARRDAVLLDVRGLSGKELLRGPLFSVSPAVAQVNAALCRNKR